MKKFLRVSGICLLVFVSFVASAAAQQVSGVTGVVTDSSGAAVPGVSVRLENTLTGFVAETTTSDTGVYIFAKVPPRGGYRLTFTKENFSKLSMGGLALGVGNTETFDAKLDVGQVSQTVEVKVGAETLNTTDASVGNVLDSQILHALPLLIRESPANLLGLQAGVVAGSASNGAFVDQNRSGAITGARTDQGNVTLDGIDVNDETASNAFATVGNAPIDSIQEYRTITANQDAQGGRSAGGQVLLTTKSGTNSFHGSAYEYNRTAATAANDFFNNRIGVKTPALTRNQFGGSIGGPIKKDKLFFFFNYEGRRDAQGLAVNRTVPLADVRNGQLGYVNNGNDANGNPCRAVGANAARLNNPVTAQCVTILSATQVAGFDPQGVGADAALESVINSRYPVANDLTAGDGINTGLFRFNAPFRRDHNTYVGRIDYKINSKQTLFGRFNIVRTNDTQTPAQFLGDPVTATAQDHDYAFVIGHTWTINSNNINSLTFGITRQSINFPVNPGVLQAFPNITTYGPYSGAFPGISSQSRNVPVPTGRDDYTWVKGKHQMSFGVNIRPVRQNTSLTNDFNFLSLGIGGNINSLGAQTINGQPNPLRPNDILNSVTARREYDAAFPFLLGRFASQSTNFNYLQNLQAKAPGSGQSRDFAYNEFEGYWQDSWRPRNDLTITYGVRWSFDGVPYEVNGFETVPSIGADALFSARVLAGQQGNEANNASPFLTYDIGGKANGTNGYYQPDLTNFGPRLGIAWNPSFKDGLLNKVFGDRKTVIRAGASQVFDHQAGAVTFIANQVGFLFDNNTQTTFGTGSPSNALATDPRFTGITNTPIPVVAPVQTRPVTPFVDANGVPSGEAQGQFIYAVDPNFKTPYENVITFGIQRELPKNIQLEVSYVGRFAHRLFVESDAAQIVDFKDPASGQGLINAFNSLAGQVRAGTPVTNQPFFENQIGAGGTNLVSNFFGNLLQIGDLSDTVQALNSFGLLASNVGLDGQSPTIAYVSSKGSSSYNGLLTTVRKRFSNGLQMDFNYTYSHSIDNSSTVVNTVAGGLVCDLRDLRVCRGNSDFDAKHIFVSDWVYELPFGRSGYIGRNMPKWANEIVGGWSFSGIWSYRTGFAFGTTTGAFPVGFNFDSPAILSGASSALSEGIHNQGNTLTFFKDTTAAQAAFTNPLGGQIGNRNDLRGPQFWNVDAALLKDFGLRSEREKLTLRVEAYNLFNHENFQLPSTNINSGTFGQLTATQGSARQLQVALRFEF
ncbi:MAG TPA: carboxypeptidase-like regulatory domain-containing protein [Candidatus Acidoferrum sp.]|nr:carboxypeptidase-like regulatory domain-containing protein [Candidatus Acidoferrum sp.]